jgi:hypothetical protein
MPLNDERWTVLARELRRTAARAAPGWSDSNTDDPGVALLELLVYALDELGERRHTLSTEARALADGVARRAATLACALGTGSAAAGSAPVAGDECGPGLQRPRYFAGRLLDADTLNSEQQYLLERLRRLHVHLHGAGIVDGLAVTVESATGAPEVVVTPGLALDALGREIFVEATQRLALPGAGSELLVELAYAERPCASAPAPGEPSPPDDSALLRATRIVESFDLALASAASEGGVAIARVRRMRGRWRVDPGFEPARVRRAP